MLFYKHLGATGNLRVETCIIGTYDARFTASSPKLLPFLRLASTCAPDGLQARSSGARWVPHHPAHSQLVASRASPWSGCCLNTTVFDLRLQNLAGMHHRRPASNLLCHTSLLPPHARCGDRPRAVSYIL